MIKKYDSGIKMMDLAHNLKLSHSTIFKVKRKNRDAVKGCTYVFLTKICKKYTFLYMLIRLTNEVQERGRT